MTRLILPLLLALFLTGCREKDTLFQDLDLNKDRRLSESELEAGVAEGFFKTYDADKDGTVSTAEWRKLDPAGDPIFMKQRDPNRDGKITRKEALAAIHRRGFCREVLQDADRNNNGFVDPAEARLWASDHPEIIQRLKIGDYTAAAPRSLFKPTTHHPSHEDFLPSVISQRRRPAPDRMRGPLLRGRHPCPASSGSRRTPAGVCQPAARVC